MNPGSSISIWFFIGLSLLVNGALITASGLYELIHGAHSCWWWEFCIAFVSLRAG